MIYIYIFDASFLTDLHHGCDNANKPQAISEWSDWETSHGEIKMGPRIQRLPRLGRWIHESAAREYRGAHRRQLHREPRRSADQV